MITFTEQGVLKEGKDYRFCRGQGATDLCIDEAQGIMPGVRWITDILVSPFKFNGIFAVASMRIRDRPSTDNDFVYVRAQSIHLTKLKRKTI
ncbi:hypothetical protein I4U23_011633 [Adineta vaga]|nr:hypothetical protein I4U23_011633 [Adineta vaga]